MNKSIVSIAQFGAFLVGCAVCKIYGKQIMRGLYKTIDTVDRLRNTKLYFYEDKQGKYHPFFCYERNDNK